jgi:hypothetical protein
MSRRRVYQRLKARTRTIAPSSTSVARGAGVPVCGPVLMDDTGADDIDDLHRDD